MHVKGDTEEIEDSADRQSIERLCRPKYPELKTKKKTQMSREFILNSARTCTRKTHVIEYHRYHTNQIH